MPDKRALAISAAKILVGALTGEWSGVAGATGSIIIEYFAKKLPTESGNSYRKLLSSVEDGLYPLIAAGEVKEQDFDAVVATAGGILADFRPTIAAQIDGHLDAGAIAKDILTEAEPRLKVLGADLSPLCSRIVTAVLDAYLHHPDTVKALEPEFRTAMLDFKAEFAESRDRFKPEVAAALDAWAIRDLVRIPRRDWHDGLAHSSLLDPEYAVVPYVGREELRDGIEAWAVDGRWVSVRLYTGEGGAGKTRLMIEMCERMRRRHGWHAGFLGREAVEAAEGTIRRLLRAHDKQFLVLDYAQVQMPFLRA
ncbi:MAG: hypothetical protein IID61_15545, partial [SAR324 cluster bacterium]|nr:hypothetical protein [SAR324 cluster bacterium]